MYVKFVPVRFLLHHRIFYVHQVNEEGPADCIIWKKSSIAYKKQAAELDGTNVLMICTLKAKEYINFTLHQINKTFNSFLSVCMEMIVRTRVNVQVI